MSWLILSLVSAFCISIRQVQEKRLLGEGFDPHFLLWLASLCTVLILSPFAYFSEAPQFGARFWLTLAVSSLANTLATLLGLRALNYSDISKTVPMLAFTPAFLLLTGHFILGEFPERQGVLGVLLIVSGAYLLNVDDFRKSWFAPIAALFREKGPPLMLLAAFMLSICASADKIGTRFSSPWFWGWATQLCILLMLTPVILRKQAYLINGRFGDHYKRLLAIGFLAAISVVTGLYAITLSLVTYMIAIKRSSMLMTVAMGHYFLQEQGVRERLLGTATILVGIVLIALRGTA